MDTTITGRLTNIGERVEGDSARGHWTKQLIVIETMEQYPKKVALQLWGDDVEKADVLNLGDTLTADISIEIREFNGRWYTDVRARNIRGAGQPAGIPEPPQQPLPPMPSAQQ